MANNQGWICTYRQIQDHWLWKDKPFNKGAAWIDMILLANHKDNQVVIGNTVIEVQRGTFITSEVKLSDRWGWSRKKVRSFLTTLENEKMATKKSTTRYTTITIENYSLYQDIGTTKDTTKGTTEEQQRNTNNNNNHENNKYSYQDSHLDYAKKLQSLILEVNPGNRCKSANLDKWANEIRIMQDKDERTNDEIKQMLDYIFNKDDFWKVQIQSPSNLRKHWDKIYPKVKQINTSTRKATNGDDGPYAHLTRL